MRPLRKTSILVGLAAAALILVATYELRGDGGPTTDERLAPLADLIGGVWHEEDPAPDGPAARTTFEWTLDGRAVREHTTDGDGAELAEVLHFWHPRKESLAFQSILASGEVREGILRSIADGLELRFNAYLDEGGGASYREHLRFLGPDRVIRTVHKKTETEEILDREATFVRKRR